MNKLITKILHGWHGCARFNLKYPHWKKEQAKGAEFPYCSICGSHAYWMWGYKNKLPDRRAQEIQGAPPSESSKYWAEYDGYGKS